MTEDPIESDGRTGCVQRLGLQPSLQAFLEILRIRHKKASVEEVLREALYDLAEANGIRVPRYVPTEEDRKKLAAMGLLDHGNVTSTMSGRTKFKKHGQYYVELIFFYGEEDKWTQRLLEKLQCTWPQMLLLAVQAYDEKDVSH